MERVNQVIRVEEKNEHIEIHPLGDLHYGNPNCRLDLFKEAINQIKETPNIYCILMGDLWDAIGLTDKRANPEYAQQEDFSLVDEQYLKLKKIIEPIKDKVLVSITGNHERTIFKRGNTNLTKRLSKSVKDGGLGIPFGGYSCFLNIQIVPKTHRRNLVVYAHHGWSAGRMTGAVVNNVERLPQSYDADCYLVAHSHQLWSTRRVMLHYGGNRSVAFGATGSFLETATWGKTSYSEEAGYPPIPLGHLKIKFYPYKPKEQIFISE